MCDITGGFLTDPKITRWTITTPLPPLYLWTISWEHGNGVIGDNDILTSSYHSCRLLRIKFLKIQGNTEERGFHLSRQIINCNIVDCMFIPIFLGQLPLNFLWLFDCICLRRPQLKVENILVHKLPLLVTNIKVECIYYILC